LSTMVRLLCCSDNVRKRKKLPEGTEPSLKRDRQLSLRLGIEMKEAAN
jgi:hypothetical protein